MNDALIYLLLPSQKAAAIQLGLRGVARAFAQGVSPAAIIFGVVVEGAQTDPVAYLLCFLRSRCASREDERALQSGTQLMGFAHRPAERIDALSTRFDPARHEADIVGVGMP